MVGCIASVVRRIAGSEGGVALAFQVDRMVVVQGEPLPVVLWELPSEWKAASPAARASSLGAGCWWSVT